MLSSLSRKYVLLIQTVTLVASAPEVQYVALRNIDLLLQAKPDILSKELRVFFCKYNDPPYVKLQKLEIMVRIANDKNVDQLLAELKEYGAEVDMDFVRRAVKAIGQVAIKIESASEKCVNTLLDLIATKVNYVVQEAIVVIKDIFRKYPGYEGIIPTLCKYIDELDEPEARGALIWIVGEYAEKISNADDILSGFVEGFMDENTQVSCSFVRGRTTLANIALPDTTPNPHSCRQTLPKETGQQPNPCAASSPASNCRERQPRYPRPCLRLLASSFWRPGRCQICYPLRQARDHHNDDFTATFATRVSPNRAIYSRVRLPQAAGDLCWPGPLRCRRHPARRNPRADAECVREPHCGLGRHHRDPEQRRESFGHRLRWCGTCIVGSTSTGRCFRP